MPPTFRYNEINLSQTTNFVYVSYWTSTAMAITPAQPVLSTHDLTVGYTVPRKSPIEVVENITVNLLAGELVCLIGPTGAGKSTLMRTLAGMQAPLAGTIQLM